MKGDELTACGSMDYRNYKDQDPITISSDLTHIFKVDDKSMVIAFTFLPFCLFAFTCRQG